LGAIAKLLFGISPAETTVARRGFRGGDSAACEHIERIGRTFADAYHAALEDDCLERLAPRLDRVEREFRGFAYEGAAMGLALLDRLTPWRRDRVRNFLSGAGEPHTYMVHVAIGWVAARLPGKIERVLKPLDPLLRWLVVDGYGFHEGFFHWPRYINGQFIPRRLRGYACRAFDQGFGRSLWFVDGADVTLIPRTIAGFAVERQGDLWSGIGLASTYAGGADGVALKALRESAGAYQPQLAQGAAFAAKARERAGNLTAGTQVAARIFCGVSAEEAAYITDAALENLPASGPQPAYEIWRWRIQEKMNRIRELQK